MREDPTVSINLGGSGTYIPMGQDENLASLGGVPSGTWVCTEWTDWFVSYDGGKTWNYTDTDCHHQEYVS